MTENKTMTIQGALHLLRSSEPISGSARKDMADAIDAHLAQPAQAVDALQDAIFQIAERLGEVRDPDMDDMSWHTQLIARAQYLANAQAVDVDEAMVERALTYRAMQEDGAVWPDAYGADEQAAEREQMRNVLAAALNTQGPKAYCRSCQRAGMSNCGYFDECSGATCITCHRPLTRAIGNAQAEGWISVKDRLPERDKPAIYWHTSEFGGFAAIADEWRDEHHLKYASHWMPYAPPRPEE